MLEALSLAKEEDENGDSNELEVAKDRRGAPLIDQWFRHGGRTIHVVVPLALLLLLLCCCVVVVISND